LAAKKTATKKSKSKGRGKAKRSDEGEARAAALAVAEAGLEKKALAVEIIDVRGKVDYADYVVVMSGRSDRQVNAIARGVEEHLKKKLGVRANGVEGLPQGTWVLMDFGDVVVHVFHEDTRGYYDVESLWIDAARVHVDEAASA
jgi:ribosome-associated protein